MNKKTTAKLYKKYARKAFMTAYSITENYDSSMDILQETFMKIFTNIENIENPTTYIITAIRHNALNYIKREKRYYPEQEIAVHIDMINQIDLKEKLSKLNKTMTILSKREKEVFSMKFYSAMNYKEIAIATELSQSTVRGLFKRAIDKLKDELYV